MHPLLFEPSQGWTYGAGMDWAGRTVSMHPRTHPENH
jgi:hypothetical protein